MRLYRVSPQDVEAAVTTPPGATSMSRATLGSLARPATLGLSLSSLLGMIRTL